MGVCERQPLQHAARRLEVEFGFPGKARHYVAAYARRRHQLCRRRDERVDVLDGVWTAHVLQDAVRPRLDRRVEKAADVLAFRHRLHRLHRAGARLHGAEADARLRAGCRRKRRDQVGKPLPLGGVEREAASGDDDFVVAGVHEPARLVHEIRKGDRDRLAAELRHYAEGALSVAAVLRLQVGARGPRRSGVAALCPFVGAPVLEASLDPYAGHRMKAAQPGYQQLAVALGAGRHRTAADDEEVGLVVAPRHLPSLCDVVGLLLECLCLV